jgi:putative NADH-flavin reductase
LPASKVFREWSIKRTNKNRSNKEPTMKLFVIGATGRTGQEIVQQALERGHHLTAFVRSPQAVILRHERLSVIKGNATDENQLSEAMQSHDAVLSALGPRKVFKPSSLLHDSALATVRAMQRSGVKRLVILSAAAHFPGIPNHIVSLILRNHMRDSRAMEEVVRGSGLDWTIARPPRLTQEQYTAYRSQEGAAPRKGFTLSRKAVAAFMLDAIDQSKHFQKTVGIAK